MLKFEETRILNWNEISGKFTDGLILGNGASIAISESFSYDSLLKQAKAKGYLDEGFMKIFNYFNTKDFELVLKILHDACFVTKTLKIEGAEKLEENYNKIRDALINIIRDTHCGYQEVVPYFDRIIKFLSNFSIVVSLNYDLIVYWALMAEKGRLGGRNLIKDCFVNKGGRKFRYDWEWLKKPYDGLSKSILLFYQHGNLILANDPFGNEEKIVRDEDSDDGLLNAIFNNWKFNHYSPLFVSEGKSAQKLKAIRRSAYLSNIYDKVLPNMGRSIVIYGSSLSDSDKHIFDQILKSTELEEIAISVLDEKDMYEKIQRIRGYCCERDVVVMFFQAKSGWIYDN